MFTLIGRVSPLPNDIALLVAVGSPYVALVVAAVLVFSVIRRWLALMVAAAAIQAANLIVQVPWY